MANTNPSSNLERAAQAADEFENKRSQGGELDAQDFKAAGQQATAAVSDAATAVKEAIVGPSDSKDGSVPSTATASSDIASAVAAKPASADAAPPASADASAPTAGGPSVIAQLQDKTAGALASLQQAVEPKADTKSADPEVNEFRSLVAEVFDNMKESIAPSSSAAPATTQQGPNGGALPDAAAASDAAQRKAVASSPAEGHRSVLGQLMDKILPTAHAETRSPGEPPVGEGKSKGLIQDLAENVETVVEEATGHHHGRRSKWDDAKDEARESGYQAKESVRDAASALADQTRRGLGRAEHETRRFADRAGDATAGAAQEGADVTRDAKDRVKRDWPGREVRGVVEETKDLTGRAADRVKGDWERTKDGAQDMLDNSSAARQWRAEHAPAPKKERGFFGGISHALFGAADDAEDTARDAADRTRANARSAADDVSNKAHEAKENVKGFFNKAGDEAEHQANRAEDKTRGFFNRASGDTRDTADRAEHKARSFWGSTKDETDRLGDKAEAKFNRWGDRVNESVEDTENYVKDKWNQAEDYLEADLRPRTSGEAAMQSGLIPSNTEDVLATRFGRRR